MLVTTTIEPLVLFDFETLDTETKLTVKQADKELKEHLENSNTSLYRACLSLKTIHTALSFKRPGFEAYCKSNPNLPSYRTACRMVAVAEMLENSAIVAEIPMSQSALYLLAYEDSETQRELIKRLQEIEAGEEITVKTVKEIKNSLGELKEAIKTLWLGDYVRLVTDKVGKIIGLGTDSAKVKIDSEEVSVPLSTDYISEVFIGDWKDGDSGELELIYKGWEVSFLSEDGVIKSVSISDSFDCFQCDRRNKDGILFDKDWLILQAKKEINRLESRKPRPNTSSFWSEAESELGEYFSTIDNGKVYLLIIEGTSIIIGCQLRTNDGQLFNLIDNEYGLDLQQWPQCFLDKEWWEEQAKALRIEEDEDRPKRSKLPKGHLHAIPKSKGENTKPHPDFEKYGVGQMVKTPNGNGRVLAKDNLSLTVEINGIGEKFSFTDVQNWTPEAVPPIDPIQSTPKPNIHFSTETNEHYTPSHLIEQIREFLGEIDLDPSSNETANRIVKANRYFSLENDGLSQEWEAETVFLNPPYGKQIEEWTGKLCHSYEQGTVKEGILLIPSRTDTFWFNSLSSNLICFLQGRIKFWSPQAILDNKGTQEEIMAYLKDPKKHEEAILKSLNTAPFPSAIVYLGERKDEFVSHFSSLGGIWQKL